MDMQVFGRRLQRLREDRGLLQKEVADVLKIARGTYANYEASRRVPEAETLRAIAEYFDVSLDYLTGRSDVAQPAAAQSESDRLLLRAAGHLSQADRDKVLAFVRFLETQIDEELDGKKNP